MTAVLDPRTVDKLAKLCGLFSSDHDGERAAAAAKADSIVRAHGLTWRDVIALRSTTRSIEEQLGIALANLDALTMWERGFVYSINGRQTLSPKQQALLDRIAAKARAYAEHRPC